MGAGSVIHAVADEQDMRKLGGLKNILPFSYSIMLIGSLALIGFPFLTGFYSKDTILEIAYAKYTVEGHFCYYLGTLAAFFTAFYSTRLLFLVFLSEPNGNRKSILNAHEGSWRMTLPLFLLSLFSISIGYITKELFIGFGTDFWQSAIFVSPQNYLLTDIEFIDLLYKQLPLILTLSGVSCAYFLYAFNLQIYYGTKKTKIYKYVYNFLSRKWYFDRLYNQVISQNILYYSYQFSYKDIDRGLIEILGPSGFITLIYNTQQSIKYYQTGNIFHYLFIFAMTIFIILFVLILFYENIFSSVLIFTTFFLMYIFFKIKKDKANIT